MSVTVPTLLDVLFKPVVDPDVTVNVTGTEMLPPWLAVTVTVAAAVLMLQTRINPLWLLCAGGALGGLGLL